MCLLAASAVNVIQLYNKRKTIVCVYNIRDDDNELCVFNNNNNYDYESKLLLLHKAINRMDSDTIRFNADGGGGKFQE